MSIYRMKLDKNRCIHCKACEVHCQAKNAMPPDLKLGVHTSSRLEMKNGRPVMNASYRSCYHCKEPACVEICPTDAMRIREEDGLVYMEPSLCIGCEACIDECPWHIPVFNEATNVVMKCDFCMDRLDNGLLPACVTACTTHALSFTKK